MFDSEGTPVGDELRLGLIAVERYRDPQMLIGSEAVHVFRSGTGGAAGGAFQYHAAQAFDGSVHSPVTALVSGRAAMEQPSVAVGDDVVCMTWGQQADGVTQVFYESFPMDDLEDGRVEGTGSRITVGPRASFEPAVWLDEDGYPYVLFHRIGDLDQGNRLQLHVVNRRYPENPSIWYILGYEEGGMFVTLVSVIYLQVQTMALAALGTFSSFGAMVAAYLGIFALRRIGVFSDSAWGKRLQILALLTAVWLLKDPATVIYANPVMVGPLYSWLVYAVGAACVFLSMRWRQLSADDELTVILGLVLFVMWEYYYSSLPMLSRFG